MGKAGMVMGGGGLHTSSMIGTRNGKGCRIPRGAGARLLQRQSCMMEPSGNLWFIRVTCSDSEEYFLGTRQVLDSS
jgi:hypothetical protein